MPTSKKPKLNRAVLREAFHASGEKHYQLSKLFYAGLFGADWDYALLGFAYMKILDNLVDEDPDPARATARLADQRALMDRVYAGRPVEEDLPTPEKFAYHVFRYDAAGGVRLRRYFEDMIATMEYDLKRRNVVLTQPELEAWVRKVGGTAIRYLVHFASPRHPVPDGIVDRAGAAYLLADSIIDVEEDLRQGLINVPAEEIEKRGIELDMADPHLRGWLESESAGALRKLDAAITESSRLESLSMRLLVRLYLSRKKRRLNRFLAEKGLGAHA